MKMTQEANVHCGRFKVNKPGESSVGSLGEGLELKETKD
jgi:hypothetical protein